MNVRNLAAAPIFAHLTRSYSSRMEKKVSTTHAVVYAVNPIKKISTEERVFFKSVVLTHTRFLCFRTGREGERDREREKEREWERDRDRDRERETERETERERERERIRGRRQGRRPHPRDEDLPANDVCRRSRRSHVHTHTTHTHTLIRTRTPEGRERIERAREVERRTKSNSFEVARPSLFLCLSLSLSLSLLLSPSVDVVVLGSSDLVPRETYANRPFWLRNAFSPSLYTLCPFVSSLHFHFLFFFSRGLFRLLSSSFSLTIYLESFLSF